MTPYEERLSRPRRIGDPGKDGGGVPGYVVNKRLKKKNQRYIFSDPLTALSRDGVPRLYFVSPFRYELQGDTESEQMLSSCAFDVPSAHKRSFARANIASPVACSAGQNDGRALLPRQKRKRST